MATIPCGKPSGAKRVAEDLQTRNTFLKWNKDKEEAGAGTRVAPKRGAEACEEGRRKGHESSNRYRRTGEDGTAKELGLEEQAVAMQGVTDSQSSGTAQAMPGRDAQGSVTDTKIMKKMPQGLVLASTDAAREGNCVPNTIEKYSKVHMRTEISALVCRATARKVMD